MLSELLDRLNMSATWTAEAIRQLLEAQEQFVCEAFWYGVLMAFGSVVPLVLLAWIGIDPDYLIAHLPMPFFACLCGGQPTGLLLTYLSPPTWLTLGYQIGGFMPADCQTSQLIEGRGRLAWPCQALDFKAWLLYAAGLGDGQSHVRFDPLWLVYLFFLACMMFLIIGAAFLPRVMNCAMEREKQEKQEKQRKEQEQRNKEEKEQLRMRWEIESGIARGIEAWKAHEKAYTDKHSLD